MFVFSNFKKKINIFLKKTLDFSLNELKPIHHWHMQWCTFKKVISPNKRHQRGQNTESSLSADSAGMILNLISKRINVGSNTNMSEFYSIILQSIWKYHTFFYIKTSESGRFYIFLFCHNKSVLVLLGQEF